MVYPETWLIENQKHIQYPGIFRTLAYSESEAYLEPCQTSTMKRFAKIVNGYNYFYIIIILAKLAAFSTTWNKYLEVVSPEVVILCKKLWRTKGARDHEFLMHLLIYSNELVYLQLTVVLIYGRSPPKVMDKIMDF